MKTFGHVLFHVGAIVLQVGVVAGHFVPPPWNIPVVAGVAAAQGVAALVAARKKDPIAREAPPLDTYHGPG